jgi:hypothetical protein
MKNTILQTQIMNAVGFGTLKYLTPLATDPVTGDDGVITTTTTIKWTNQ